ncbi:VAP [Symbiodinium sp. CCMP2456]|nr:VAP [Symbiodinium sp. CCMP2456]
MWNKNPSFWPLLCHLVDKPQVLANLGAAYGTAKSGVGIANLGARDLAARTAPTAASDSSVMRPDMVMRLLRGGLLKGCLQYRESGLVRSIIPVVMAGVPDTQVLNPRLGIYGLITSVIINGGDPQPDKFLETGAWDPVWNAPPGIGASQPHRLAECEAAWLTSLELLRNAVSKQLYAGELATLAGQRELQAMQERIEQFQAPAAPQPEVQKVLAFLHPIIEAIEHLTSRAADDEWHQTESVVKAIMDIAEMTRAKHYNLTLEYVGFDLEWSASGDSLRGNNLIWPIRVSFMPDTVSIQSIAYVDPSWVNALRGCSGIRELSKAVSECLQTQRFSWDLHHRIYIVARAGVTVGMSSLAAGPREPRLFVGMILILIFAEALGLYGLIVGLVVASTAEGKGRAAQSLSGACAVACCNHCGSRA